MKAYPLQPQAFAANALYSDSIMLRDLLRATAAQRLALVGLDVAADRADELMFADSYVSPLATSRNIAGPGGRLELRVFTPDTVRGVYLHMHGGAWVLGGAHLQDSYLEKLATHGQQVVVSVQYRLAPEHPYPAAPDDCAAAACWLVQNAQKEFGTTRLTLGGESAGAHLAAVTLLRLRDVHGMQGAFSAANLLFGMYDLSLTPSARHKPEDAVIPTPMIRRCVAHFAGDASVTHADVSPLYAPLHHLPPALFTVGTDDPLLDDSMFMYSRWLAAGNAAEIALYPGGFHGFVGFPGEASQQARVRCTEFLSAP